MPRPRGKRGRRETVAVGVAWCGRQLLTIVVTAMIIGALFVFDIPGFLGSQGWAPHYVLIALASIIVSVAGVAVWFILWSYRYLAGASAES